jgi:hypothetical protein
MRLTGKESDQRWIKEEEKRRRAESFREEIAFLAAAGLDATGIILLVAWERRRR